MTYIEDSNPVFAACERGDVEAVRKYLDNGGTVYAESAQNNKLISTACAYGHLEIVDLLLKRGLDPNRPFNVHKQPPLCQTIIYDQLAIAKRLIEGGADVNARDEYENVPIHFAVGGDQKDFFDLFVQAGADLEAVNYQGEALIHTAARENSLNILEALEKFRGGVSDIINMEGAGGDTPLAIAARRGHLEAAEWLLQRGADPAVTVDFGDTLPEVARENGHSRMVEFLEKHLKRNKSSK